MRLFVYCRTLAILDAIKCYVLAALLKYAGKPCKDFFANVSKVPFFTAKVFYYMVAYGVMLLQNWLSARNTIVINWEYQTHKKTVSPFLYSLPSKFEGCVL